jgi:hypothetical protein
MFHEDNLIIRTPTKERNFTEKFDSRFLTFLIFEAILQRILFILFLIRLNTSLLRLIFKLQF